VAGWQHTLLLLLLLLLGQPGRRLLQLLPGLLVQQAPAPCWRLPRLLRRLLRQWRLLLRLLLRRLRRRLQPGRRLLQLLPRLLLLLQRLLLKGATGSHHLHQEPPGGATDSRPGGPQAAV
jgi:hypothetical protein